jgi:hypothetical protein
MKRLRQLACNTDALCDPFFEFDGVNIDESETAKL